MAQAMKVRGHRVLIKKLNRLATSAVRNRMIRRPTSAALTPISKAAKQNAPVDRKFLRKSIGKKVKTYKNGVWGGVGPRVGDKFIFIDDEGRRRIPANYAHIVHKRNPFLRRAFDSKIAIARRIQANGIKANLKKEALKR